MRITVYGAGYVGLVSAICLAQFDHKILCVDINKEKIDQLSQCILPIYEEKLESLLKSAIANHQISFTTHSGTAISHAEVQIIAVGTPEKSDGSADLQYVFSVINQIASNMDSYRCFVIKSTVPPGTSTKIKKLIQDALDKRGVNIKFDVVSNPEFLREGQAVNDFLHPDRIVLGLETERADKIMRAMYQPITDQNYPLITMDNISAELTKYAANAFLATKISFMNEMSQIAEKVGANINRIKNGMGLDNRINQQFLNAGCGFGGSCFPKDVSALQHTAKTLEYDPLILSAVLNTNKKLQQKPFEQIYNYFNGDIKGKTIAIWGLAFKPNTDDIRCASSCVLIDLLLSHGAKIKAYDPMASENISKLYPNENNLSLCHSAADTLQGADTLAVITEWAEFASPCFKTIKKLLKYPVIFDGRNLYERKQVNLHGLDYFGIGT